MIEAARRFPSPGTRTRYPVAFRPDANAPGRGHGAWGGTHYSAACVERVSMPRFQRMTVTANTTMMAAQREPRTARGKISLRYFIATPAPEPGKTFLNSSSRASGEPTRGNAK
jgi:hypothetical protein